jgi:hypothetical protein
MDAVIKALILLFVLIELVYLASCIVSIQRVLKYKNTTAEIRILANSTILFLSSCILGSIAHNFQTIIGEKLALPFFILFLVVEILYLVTISRIALENPRVKTSLCALLLSSLLFIPYLATKKWTGFSFYPLFAYESLIATSISFAFFLQLGDEKNIKNVFEDPKAIIMLGLFFCYSIPFAYNSVMAAINLIDENFYAKIMASKYDKVLLTSISRVGTICYLILNIFIYKAFECKTQTQVGISLER